MDVAVVIRMGHDWVPDWKAIANYVVEAEKLGAGYVYTSEAWVHDTVSVLGFLAARTSRLKLVTGIMQAGTRSPALVAMTAQTLEELSDGRFILGLGTSGPQVIEGWHGVPFKLPVTRMRELMEIVRIISRGERLVYKGKVYELPLPGGEGKALRSPIRDLRPVPIFLGTQAPKSLEMTGELADGWIGGTFFPERPGVFLDPIARGADRSGRTLADLELHVNVDVDLSADVERAIARKKPGIAFNVGGMGSRDTNFHKDAYKLAGFGEAVDRIQELWLDGQREQARMAVPDELVLQRALVGTDEMIRARLRLYRDAGITALRVFPEGETPDEWVSTLGRVIKLTKEVSAEQPAARH